MHDTEDPHTRFVESTVVEDDDGLHGDAEDDIFEMDPDEDDLSAPPEGETEREMDPDDDGMGGGESARRHPDDATPA